MNKKVPNMFRTYIWLIDTIRRLQPINLEEINERWLRTEMSEGIAFNRNTFKRYIEGIESMFDINIDCDRRNHYRYSISDTRALRSDSMQRWMLSTMSVAGIVRESRQLQDRIVLENVPSGDLLLTELTRAMENGKMVRIVYRKFVDSQPYETEVEPYCLKLFRQRWYLLAHREGRDYIATYALDRMLSAEETPNDFHLPADFDAQQHFAHLFGVFQPAKNERPQVIRLRTYDGEWNYLRTLPLHPSQQEIESSHPENEASQKTMVTIQGDAEKYVDFKLVLYPTTDFKFELLSHASSIEVLEPLSLRNELRQMLEKGLKRNG